MPLPGGKANNATFDMTTRASMSQLRNDSRYNSRRYTGTFVVAKQGTVGREGTGGAWWFRSGTQTVGDPNYNSPWQVCANGDCLGWNQHNTSCNCGTTWTDKDRIRYLAEIGGGRRNTRLAAAAWFPKPRQPAPLSLYCSCVDLSSAGDGCWAGAEAGVPSRLYCLRSTWR